MGYHVAEYKRHPSCDICGSNELSLLGVREELTQNKIEAIQFRYEDSLCNRCGFIFSQTRPANFELTRYYKNYFSSMSTLSEQEAKARAEIIDQHVERGGKVLDVGGGYGMFSEYLARLGFATHNYDLASGSEPEGEFDAVCHFYVLEHQPFPRIWFEEQLRFLKPDGVLVVEVPDFERHPMESLNNEHLCHFRPSDLRRLFNDAGFSCEFENRSDGLRSFGMTAVGTRAREADRHEYQSPDLARQRERYSDLMLATSDLEKTLHEIARVVDRPEAPRIGLWPANQLTLRVLKAFERLGLQPHALVDSDQEKIGMKWGGMAEVMSPLNPKSRACEAFLNLSDQYGVEITNALLDMGFEARRIFQL